MRKTMRKFIASCVVIMIPLSVAGQANATVSREAGAVQYAHVPTGDQINETIDRYSYTSPEGLELTDVEQAKEGQVDAFVIEVMSVYNEMLVEEYRVEKGLGTPRQSIANRWGWCGKYRTNGGNPHNSADRICMNHDHCLNRARNSGAKIGCDNAFISGMRSVAGRYSGADRAYIEAAIRVISAARLCRPVGC